MRLIKTDLHDLCDAYAINNDEIDHYLDMKPGKLWFDPVLTGER